MRLTWIRSLLFTLLLQAASDISSPLSGEVTAVNDELTDDSAKVGSLCSHAMFP